MSYTNTRRVPSSYVGIRFQIQKLSKGRVGSMEGMFIKDRVNIISTLKESAPELDWLLGDIKGVEGIKEVQSIISRLEGFDTGNEPNVSGWGLGMSIAALVAYLVKYKEDYTQCI